MIQDKLVKDESLSFASNTSWVSVVSTQTYSGENYTTAKILIDHSAVVGYGDANYSVKINVTDSVGNSDERIFRIEILFFSSGLISANVSS